MRGISNSFGLNAYKFFGLGLPFVRRAIEALPFSIAAVVSTAAPQYRPVYAHYSVDDYLQFLKFCGEDKGLDCNDCARARGLQ
jgi:hypothetical protein